MKKGFTLIELLIVIAIVSVFIFAGIFAYRLQLAKGRDARRKADLNKIQNTLEDYYNDNGSYPSSFVCGDTQGKPLEGYAITISCDPLNNLFFNYYYSNDSTTPKKSWYKIFGKLENTTDPIISKLDCESGCGPDGNYNYWVSSPNVSSPAQQPGEDWPAIGGATPTPTLAPTSTPTPVPPPPCEGQFYGCFSGVCEPISGCEQCPSKNYMDPNCLGMCVFPENYCH